MRIPSLALAGALLFSFVLPAAACGGCLYTPPERVAERMRTEPFDANGLDAWGCNLKRTNDECGQASNKANFVPVQIGQGPYAKDMNGKPLKPAASANKKAK